MYGQYPWHDQRGANIDLQWFTWLSFCNVCHSLPFSDYRSPSLIGMLQHHIPSWVQNTWTHLKALILVQKRSRGVDLNQEKGFGLRYAGAMWYSLWYSLRPKKVSPLQEQGKRGLELQALELRLSKKEARPLVFPWCNAARNFAPQQSQPDMTLFKLRDGKTGVSKNQPMQWEILKPCFEPFEPSRV